MAGFATPTSFASGQPDRGAHANHALELNFDRQLGAGQSQGPETMMYRFEAIVGALAAYLMTLIAIAPASADPVQPIYDPPAGSRWTIHSRWREDDTRVGKTTTVMVAYTAEFKIQEKTPLGFRIIYVMRDLDIQGDAPKGALSKILLQPHIGVVNQVTVDRNGKPVRVENFPEVQAAYQQGIADAVAAFAAHAKPEAATKMREILDANMPRDPEKAAEGMDDLPLLSLGQNTHLSLGEVRNGSEVSSSPFSGEPINTTTTLRLTHVDAASDKQTLVRTETYDPVALKRYALDAVKKVSPAAGAKLDEIVSQTSTTRVDRTEFMVEHGMTRAVSDDSMLEIKEAGLTLTKHKHKEIAVTPLQ